MGIIHIPNKKRREMLQNGELIIVTLVQIIGRKSVYKHIFACKGLPLHVQFYPAVGN